MLRVVGLGLALLALCCAGKSSPREALRPAVSDYHQLLRWKKFDNAALYRLPDDQGAFLARYLRVEDDLNIEHIEVRAVHWDPVGDIAGADVTVTAEAYLLPSTVLQKVVIRERWEMLNGRWTLMHTDRELAPTLDSQTQIEQEPSPPTGG